LPQLEAEFRGRGFKHAHAFRHHFLADAVTGNDGDAIDAIGGLFVAGDGAHGRFLRAYVIIRAGAARVVKVQRGS
jgi:hypothetical protein